MDYRERLERFKKPERINRKFDHVVNERQKQFFSEIWDERKHECCNCDELIPYPATFNFDHILEKGKKQYEHLRWEKDNVWLLCWSCHTDKGNGILSERMKVTIQLTKEKFNVE